MKIIFTDSAGRGTKTAIGTITDVVSNKIGSNSGDVALAHGILQFDDGRKTHLYGTLEGWEKFDFKEDALSANFIGLVLLIDNIADSPITDFKKFLNMFTEFIAETNIVIGVTQMCLSKKVGIEDYRTELKSRSLNPPLFEIDIRQKNDISLLVQALLSTS